MHIAEGSSLIDMSVCLFEILVLFLELMGADMEDISCRATCREGSNSFKLLLLDNCGLFPYYGLNVCLIQVYFAILFPFHLCDHPILRILLQVPPFLLTLLRVRPTPMTSNPHFSAQFLTIPLKHHFRIEVMRNTDCFRAEMTLKEAFAVAKKARDGGSSAGLDSRNCIQLWMLQNVVFEARPLPDRL